MTLQRNGRIEVGQMLEGVQADNSRIKGGDRYVAAFTGQGWLSLDINRANSLRLDGDSISLYMRTWIGSDAGGCLFFSDRMALAIHPAGLAIGFLGLKTPTGKIFRELPLAVLEKDGWKDLVLRAGNERLDLFCDGVLRSSIPLHQPLSAAFDSAMAIGAFLWDGPDLHVPMVSGIQNVLNVLHDTKVDTVALWGRALSNKEIAMLSGIEEIRASEARTLRDQAILDYNAFFDASLNKDVSACRELWKSLRSFTDQDPSRPIYHLSAPLGGANDPIGGYYFNGRYHVSTYHNIFAVLRYSCLDHYVSDDLVHWIGWPIGPWADSKMDVYGIWLMSHFLDDQGIPNVLYTALGTQGKHGILAKSRDGLISYEEKKPVLTKYAHDGHIWKRGDVWYAITTKMTKSTRPGMLGDGIMLWASSDLEHWQERSEIFTQPKIPDSSSPADRAGFTEFPYLIPFGDRDVLMLGSHPARYWVGHMDWQELKFIPDQPHGQLFDYSNRFFCFDPLCVDHKGPDGQPRRIIMALYDDLSGEVGGLPWNCVHVLPRELRLEGNHLRQEPIPELHRLRNSHVVKRNIEIKPGVTGNLGLRGDAVEIVADFEPGDARCLGLKVRLSDDGTSFVRIYFDVATQTFGVDGKVPDTHRDLNLKPGEGAPTYLANGQTIQIHVFVDKLLVEAFVNGQSCTTSALDRAPGFNRIDLFSDGGSARCSRLDFWTMKPATLK